MIIEFHKTISKTTFVHLIIISAILSLAFLGLTFPVYNAPFSMGDDHRIISMNHPDKMEKAHQEAFYGYQPDFEGSILIDSQLGRFRPISWLWVKIQSVVYGDNFLFWRFTNIFILFLSLFSLSLIFAKLGVKKPIIIVILFVYAFGRNNETWWTLIPPAQNIGELFLLLAFYYWLLFRDKCNNVFLYLSVILFFLSALSKECFIFCIPFIILLDYFFLNQRKIIFSTPIIALAITFVIPFGILLSTILYNKTLYGYANPDSVFYILGYNAWQHFFSSVFLISPLTMIVIRSYSISTRNLFIVGLITIGWVFVQLLLLKGILMDGQHHYLVPGILLVFVISGIAFESIKKKSKKSYYALLVIYVLFAASQAKNTYTNAGFYAAKNKSYQKMCTFIASSAPKRIIYVTHESISGDWITGTSAILRNMDVAAPLYFCTLSQSIADWQIDFLKSRPPLSFPVFNSQTDSLQAGDWLIFPDNLCKKGSFPWEKYERGRGEKPQVEIAANHIQITDKDLIYFGGEFINLSFRNLLNGSWTSELTGYYAMPIK